jgi:hypothetical protein
MAHFSALVEPEKNLSQGGPSGAVAPIRALRSSAVWHNIFKFRLFLSRVATRRERQTGEPLPPAEACGVCAWRHGGGSRRIPRADVISPQHLTFGKPRYGIEKAAFRDSLLFKLLSGRI